MFSREFNSIKEWRWGTVLDVLKWMLPLAIPLRRFWSAQLFGSADGDGAEALDSGKKRDLVWTRNLSQKRFLRHGFGITWACWFFYKAFRNKWRGGLKFVYVMND